MFPRIIQNTSASIPTSFGQPESEGIGSIGDDVQSRESVHMAAGSIPEFHLHVPTSFSRTVDNVPDTSSIIGNLFPCVPVNNKFLGLGDFSLIKPRSSDDVFLTFVASKETGARELFEILKNSLAKAVMVTTESKYIFVYLLGREKMKPKTLKDFFQAKTGLPCVEVRKVVNAQDLVFSMSSPTTLKFNIDDIRSKSQMKKDEQAKEKTNKSNVEKKQKITKTLAETTKRAKSKVRQKSPKSTRSPSTRVGVRSAFAAGPPDLNSQQAVTSEGGSYIQHCSPVLAIKKKTEERKKMKTDVKQLTIEVSIIKKELEAKENLLKDATKKYLKLHKECKSLKTDLQSHIDKKKEDQRRTEREIEDLQQLGLVLVDDTTQPGS